MLRVLTILILVFGYFFSQSVSTFQLEIPKTLWVFWDSEIQNAPMLVQLCVSKMMSVCKKQNWTLMILNQTNIQHHIPNFSEFMEVRRKTTHTQPRWKAIDVDLIRFNVIAANGGFYMDITTILFEGLDWLNKLDEVPYLLTNSQLQKGVQPDCIVPYISFYQNTAETRDSYGRITNWIPGYENWFFGAKKNSTFMQRWRQYFQMHFQSKDQTNRKNEIEKGYFMRHLWGDDYLNADRSAVEIVQDQQYKLDYQVTLFGQRKNANKELKMLGLHGEFGPFSLYLQYTPSFDDFLSLTVAEIQEKYFVPIRFFVKLTNGLRNNFDKCLNTIKQISRKFGYNEQVFDNFMKSMPNRLQCSTIKFIVQGSVFGGLIDDNPKAQSSNLFSITVKQRELWYDYCNTMYQIDLRKKGYSEKIYDCIKWLGDWGEIVKYLSHLSSMIKEQLNQQKPNLDNIVKVFKDMQSNCQKCLISRSWMGKLIDPSQNIFWKKKYHTELAKQAQTLSMGKQKFLTKQSETQLSWLRFKLFLFQYRIQIIDFLFIWIDIVLCFTCLSLIYITLSFTIWIIQKIYKYNIRPFVWIIQTLRQPQIILYIKRFFFTLIYQAKCIYKQATLEQCLKLIFTVLKFILLRLSAFTFGIVFFGYYTFIFHEYAEVFIDGKVFYQEIIFFLIILGQKSLKFLGSWIGKYTNILPGLPFQFLYYIFLPVYYYFFGSQILSLIYPYHNHNFSHGFIITLCIPLVIKLVQHESQNALKKIQLRAENQQNYPNKFIRNLYLTFSNLTDWMEKVVLALLILIYFTNIRFIRDSEGYILARLINFMAKPKILWLFLSTIYVSKSYYHILDSIKSTKRKVLQQNNTFKTEQSIKDQSETMIKISIQLLQAVRTFVVIVKYILRSYTIYVLLFNQNIENMIKHQSEMTTSAIEQIMCLIRYFGFVFVSFMVEIYFEVDYYSYLQKKNPSMKADSLGETDAMNEEMRVNQSENFDQDQSVTVQKMLYEKDYEVILSVCQICLFQIVRMMAIIEVYEFFNSSSQEIEFNYQQYTKYIALLISLTIVGYLMITLFISSRFRQVRFKDDSSKTNSQSKLFKQSYQQIELKEQEQNDD